MENPNSNQVFLISKTELTDRLDPQFFRQWHQKSTDILHSSKYPIVTLSNIVCFKSEKTLPKRFPNREFIYLSLANVSSHTGEIIGDTKVKGSQILSHCNVFRKGDILFSKLRPYLNKVYLVKDDIENSICSTEFVVLAPKENVNGVFLRAFLSSPFVLNQTKHMLTGYTLPRLAPHELGKVKIVLPPIEKQNLISERIKNFESLRVKKTTEANDILDGINGYLLNTLGIHIEEYQQANTFSVDICHVELEKRFDPSFFRPNENRFANALKGAKWEIKTIGELASNIVNGLDDRHYTDQGTPYIRVENVKENEIILSNVKYVNLSFNNVPSKIRLKDGDVLFTRKGSYGICAVVTNKTISSIISSEIIKISLKPTIDPHFFAAFINSSIGKMQSKKFAVGAIMPGISHRALKAMQVVVPPLEVQYLITQEISKRITLARQLLHEACELEKLVDEEIEKIILERQERGED